MGFASVGATIVGCLGTKTLSKINIYFSLALLIEVQPNKISLR